MSQVTGDLHFLLGEACPYNLSFPLTTSLDELLFPCINYHNKI